MRLYNAQTCTPSATGSKWSGPGNFIPEHDCECKVADKAVIPPDSPEKRLFDGHGARHEPRLKAPFGSPSPKIMVMKEAIPSIDPITTAETTSLADASQSDYDDDTFGPIVNRLSSGSSFLFDIDGEEEDDESDGSSFYSGSSSITTTRSVLEAMESMDLEDAPTPYRDLTPQRPATPYRHEEGIVTWPSPFRDTKFEQLFEAQPGRVISMNGSSDLPSPCAVDKRPLSAASGARNHPKLFSPQTYPTSRAPSPWVSFGDAFTPIEPPETSTKPFIVARPAIVKSAVNIAADAARLSPRAFRQKRNKAREMVSTAEVVESTGRSQPSPLVERENPPVLQATDVQQKVSVSMKKNNTQCPRLEMIKAIQVRGRRARNSAHQRNSKPQKNSLAEVDTGVTNVAQCSSKGPCKEFSKVSTPSPISSLEIRSPKQLQQHRPPVPEMKADRGTDSSSDVQRSNQPDVPSASHEMKLPVKEGISDRAPCFLESILKRGAQLPSESCSSHKGSVETTGPAPSRHEACPQASVEPSKPVSPQIDVDHFPGSDVPQSEPLLPQKYKKMLAMGLPKEAVRHAMMRDGVDSTPLDHPPVAPSTKRLPDKYARMLKMGLPRLAVDNALQRDGLDPSDYTEGQPSKATTKVDKDPLRRFRVHWDAHPNKRSNTLWAMVERDTPWLSELELNDEEMKTLFTQERTPCKAKASETGKAPSKSTQVIDPKRANNGGILLARIKMSFREVASAVSMVDETVFSLEQLEGIASLVPTDDERASLQKHIQSNGHPLKTECEKFMVELLSVQEAERKIEAMLFMKKFPAEVSELKNDAMLISRACDEILSASRLRRTLGVIMQLGNKLNTAGTAPKGSAAAITVESLLKLNQGKAFDRKTTFLQYTAQVIRRNSPNLLQFKDDLPTLKLAEKVAWDQSNEELGRIESALTSMREAALSVKEGVNLTSDEEFQLLQSTHIGRFVFNAFLQMNSLYDDMEAAKLSFEALLDYFGEESVETQPFLHTLHTFCVAFDDAVADAVVSEREKVRASREPIKLSVSTASTCSKRIVRTNRNKPQLGPMCGVLADICSQRKL